MVCVYIHKGRIMFSPFCIDILFSIVFYIPNSYKIGVGLHEVEQFSFIFLIEVKMNEFAEWLKLNRGYSDCTIRNYLFGLSLFDKYLKDLLITWWVEDCEKIKIWHIDSFVRDERKFHWKGERTVNNYLAWIKMYLRYCMILWKDVENYQKVLYVKEHKIKIDSLSDEESIKLINYFKNAPCDTERTELIKIRNLVIVSLLLYTWMRVSELSNLKWKDVKEDMQIIGKWWKRRYISIHPDDIDLINLYMFLRKDNSEWLLVNHSNNYQTDKLSNVSIQQILRNWAKAAWITTKVYPHKLRHTFASHLLKAKANLFHIQQILGHSSLQSTQHYLSVLNCELKETQNLVPRFW